MTRLERAIAELREACADRAMVVVVDRCGFDARRSDPVLYTSPATAEWMAVGLLAYGDALLRAGIDAASGDDPPAEEPAEPNEFTDPE